jgi:hypothetical protein
MKGQRPCRTAPARLAIARKATCGEMVSGKRAAANRRRPSRGVQAAIPHIRNEDTEIRVDRPVTKWNTAPDPGAASAENPVDFTPIPSAGGARREREWHLPEGIGDISVRLSFRRAVLDALSSLAALSLLFAILTAVNPELRQQVSRRLSSGQTITNAVSSTRSAATGVIRTARFQTIGYASLVLFVGAAGVLVLFMLKV